MTRIQVLRDARAEWVQKDNALKDQIVEVYKDERQALSDAVLPFFKGFSPDAFIEVTKSSVYFKMYDPARQYNKELFSLYFKEDWNDEGTSFKGVDLSYYTTSTGGLDAWELKRLRMLGDVAHILLKDHDLIVAEANASALPFKERYRAIYAQQSLVQEAISDIDNKVRRLTRERVEYELMKDGIEFTEGRNIDLKYNYSPRVISIKLIDFSKSRKKATVVFQFAHGISTSREENCSVEKIVEQVAYYYPNYAKDTKRELLPS
jgi:hypothetical protein